jgi:hypothetical protein
VSDRPAAAEVPPERWLADVADRLPGPPVGISAKERDVLLDLARVAAHTSARWTAPVTTFLAGMALADAGPADRVVALRALLADLEGGGADADAAEATTDGTSADG